MGFRLFDLNEPQHRAVTTTQGPLLILAGAGTGKTRVITARVAYLIAEGVSPENILAVTFTNKAATEMRERLASMIDPAQAKKVTMSTFHALCVRILRSGIERLGYKNNFTIYDEGDQLGLIRKIITRTAAQGEKLDPNQAKNLISKAKNNGWSAPADEKTLLSAVFARYQADLKTLNAVDFDDLLLLTVKLLSEHPEAQQKWQARFKYLMIDEFQDTNRLQLGLVSLLADASKNVAVVGDDDQSIYGWRGAEVSNILEFEQHFPNPVIVKLEQNYRSTNAILGTANDLIKNNPRRRPKALWSARDGGDKVRLIQAANDREEAQFVAEEIQRQSFAESLPWEAFAVLYRMNAQSRLIEENLRRLQIPYRLVGGKSFFDRREVKDLLAYLSVIVNPEDDSNLLRIINTPARGISAGTIERATEWSAKQKCAVWAALRSDEFLQEMPARTVGKIAEFVALIDDYETKLHEPLVDHHAIATELLKQVDYVEDLKRTCKTPDEALKREESIRQIMQDFSNFLGRSTNGLQGFLDEVMLDRNRQEDDDIDRKKGVLLITLHAAKGLEFPHVFLVGLEEGILPHDRSKLEGTLDEERRLLYVGITRAMRTLTMSYCRDRMKYGSAAPCHPSSFIKELPEQWIERKNLTEMMNAPVKEDAAKNGFARMRALLGTSPEA
ncbi:MAG TPA: UvrD-helicase domain-containing protein [Chthoniobacteraceae bacterium]|jgi:superfamily I DNA/RNA helicase|nr:UvrD-helicase domain-containing protein [Chthoniobacteraceae bacterium]